MNTTAESLEPTTSNAPRTVRPARRLRRVGVVLLALAVALADWFVTARLIGIDLEVSQGSGSQPIQPALVAAAPVVSGLLGWVLLAILERTARHRATLIWRCIAAVVLAVSLLSPITMAQSAATMGVLLSMHLLVGAILIVGLPLPAGRSSVRS